MSGPDVVTRIDVLADEKLDFFVVEVDHFGKLERSDWRSLRRSFLAISLNKADWVLEDLRSVLTDGHPELVGNEALLLDSSFLWVSTHGDE